MIKSTRKGIAAAVALILLVSTFGSTTYAAWNPAYPSLYKEYKEYFGKDMGVYGTAADVAGPQATHHFNVVSVDFSMSKMLDLGRTQAEYIASMAAIKALRDRSDDKDDDFYYDATAEKNDKLSAEVAVYLFPKDDPKVKANYDLLKSIHDYNLNPANTVKKNKVRVSALFANDGSDPQEFMRSGFSPAGIKASDDIIQDRTTHYIAAVLDSCKEYADAIDGWDVFTDFIDDSTGQVRKGTGGQLLWGDFVSEFPDMKTTVGAIEYALQQTHMIGRPINRDWKYYLSEGSAANYPNKDKLDYIEQLLSYLKAAPWYKNIDGFGLELRLSSAYYDLAAIGKQIEAISPLVNQLAITKMDIRTDAIKNEQYKPDQPTTGSAASPNNPPILRDSAWTVAKSVDDTVMKAHADAAATVVEYLMDEYAGKLAYVEWDGLNDDVTRHDKDGAADFWSSPNAPAPKDYIEKQAFFAVLGIPARKELAKALVENPNFNYDNIKNIDRDDVTIRLTGPAIDDPANEAFYTEDSWKNYVDAHNGGQKIYDDKIYDIGDYDATKKATEDIYDAVRHLEQREEDPVLNLSLSGTALRLNKYLKDTTFSAIEYVKITNQDGKLIDPKMVALEFTSSTFATAEIDKDTGLVTMKKGGTTSIAIFLLNPDGTRGKNVGFVLNVVKP